MPQYWREYKTPDGTNYYYNVNTKRSTTDKPDDFEEYQSFKSKSRRLDPGVTFVVPLTNDWVLSVCENGQRFFYKKSTGESQWSIEDYESLRILSLVDKEKLVLLLAVARGLDIGERDVYQEVLEDISNIKQNNGDSESPKVVETAEEPLQAVRTLIAAYESSDEDGGSCDEENAEEEVHGGDIVSNSDIEELGAVSLEQDRAEKQKFISLFEEYGLDPYSTWNMQSKKISDDPIFYQVASDAERKELFEGWCAAKVKLEDDAEGPASCEIPSGGEDLSADELEPTRYHYLAHIVSKAEVTPSKLPKDLRSEQKQLFKQFKIKESLGKKQQDEFLSKLLFYYKNMTEEQRSEVFIKLLKTKRKVISKGLKDTEQLQSILSQHDLPESGFEIESQLLRLEDCIDIHGTSKTLQDEVQYYLLGIRQKTIALKKFLSELNNSS
ncbi:LAQU0S14e01310g1_1 [Lachancea quebecensis]|uniref:LAQU0S14e01310g1_1 n=1 Tax=Lachancea quebecensis TaxID=1654605 RepID=A0A0P1KVE6_9SACH|nr:LAQU0S14e01310g1_1 [Lachancea quebecensis]